MKTLTNRLSGLILIAALVVSVFGIKSASAQANIKLGSGTLVTSSTQQAPVNAFWRFSHQQFVYTKTELNAAGATGARTFDEIGWFVVGAPIFNLPNYTIYMQNTTQTSAGSNFGQTLDWTKNPPLTP